MESTEIPIPNEVAEDDAALQQLIRDKFTNDPTLGDWVVGTGQFSDLQRSLPQGRKLCGVLVRVRSENGAVRVGSDIKTDNVETGLRFEDEHYLLVVEPGDWCMTLGKPTYRLVLH
ncbi:MAG: hypothetical protein Q9207_002572 [Kuettlingeria erythrocarpa]